MELRFMMSVGMVWIHGSPLTKSVVEHQIEEVAEQNRKLVYQFFKLFDNELRKRPFVAGESYSMADIIAFTTLEFAERLNDLHPRDDQEALLAWRDACEARPSAKA